MRFIRPSVHGVLDYLVALALIAVPLVADFGRVSPAAAGISIAAGTGLALYSLLTDYAAGLRRVIPWRLHLRLDAAAAVVLAAVPIVLDLDGGLRAFFLAVAVADLLVVLAS